jgi:hypothetical protein
VPAPARTCTAIDSGQPAREAKNTMRSEARQASRASERASVYASVHACKRACERAREQACVPACVCPSERACERTCVRAYERACVRASVRACVCASARAHAALHEDSLGSTLPYFSPLLLILIYSTHSGLWPLSASIAAISDDARAMRGENADDPSSLASRSLWMTGWQVDRMKG